MLVFLFVGGGRQFIHPSLLQCCDVLWIVSGQIPLSRKMKCQRSCWCEACSSHEVWQAITAGNIWTMGIICKYHSISYLYFWRLRISLCSSIHNLFIIFFHQYVQYSKLKRIIKRNKFIADRDIEASADAESNINGRKGSSPANGQSALNKNTYGDYSSLLQSNNSTNDGPIVSLPDDESDFFKVILSEMEKVNKFFVG